jgi:hypothetical protein
VRETIFGQIIKRAEWSLLLVQTLFEKRIEPTLLGPSNLHRLRTQRQERGQARQRSH